MTESFNDKEMEETNGDSQDSETSSTSSWVLLNSDENSDDNASRKDEQTLFVEAETNPVIESRNSQSDIESDGISIISENEFYQAKNYDESSNFFEEGKWYAESELTKTQDENEAIDEPIQNDVEVEKSDVESIYSTEESYQLPDDSFVSDDDNNEMDLSLEDSQKNVSLECRCNLDQKFDYNRLLTWPSLLGTSVVILAVFIFPFFSSDSKELGDMQQHDVYGLPDENLDNIDSLIFCREKHKKGSTNAEYYFEKCLKAQRKNSEHSIAKKRFPSKHKGRFSQYTYLKKSLRKNKYNTGRDKIDSQKKLLNFDETWQTTEKDKPNHDHHDVKIDGKFWENRQHELHIGKNPGKISDEFAKYVFDQLQAQFDKKRKYLAQKEKYLEEWEQRLIKRERKIQRYKQEDKYRDNKHKQWKYRMNSTKKQKGDMDYDNSHIHKMKRNEKRKDMSSMKRNEKKKNMSSSKYQEKNNKRNCASNECNKQILKENESSEPKTETITEKDSPDGKNSIKKDSSSRKTFRKYRRSERKIAGHNIDEQTRPNSKSHVTNTGSNYFKVQSPPRKNQTRIFDDDNVTLTGEWYLNLVNGRQDIRKKEEKAHWWFDRVEFRKNKRNKAHWYFQYMFNRENLRYRSKNI